MRVTYLLVAFLAGARSFKAVERRAKPMGKGGGGVVARSVVEAAIQALAVDDKIAARHAVNVAMADVDAANHMLEAIRQMNGAEQAELFAYARHWVSERIF